MPRLYLIGAASLAALAFAACGDNTMDTADTTGTTDTTATTPVDTAATATADAEAAIREGQEFVNAAGQAGMVEIRTSEMALEKSTNADVKAFAQMMIDDHKAAADKLNAAASAAALAMPPATLDDFHMRRINDLVEVDGDEDFDTDYMALQVDAHNDAIKLFEGYSRDPDTISQLKAFADETMPTLVAHKADAERIRDTVGKTDAVNPS